MEKRNTFSFILGYIKSIQSEFIHSDAFRGDEIQEENRKKQSRKINGMIKKKLMLKVKLMSESSFLLNVTIYRCGATAISQVIEKNKIIRFILKEIFYYLESFSLA